jgi:CRISPR-associated protein Csb1
MIERLDGWLQNGGPVALVIREYLEPVTGEGSVFFPPTFAPPEGQKGEKPDYVIDEGGVCLVDSVGSQGNRLEPIFKQGEYAGLVPQVTITAGARKINLLDAGHRAADAIVRFSDLWLELRCAFLAYRDRGDARAMAKIAPTSLVFGAWDSRDTQTKIPRLVESTVRAYGVQRLSRSAQYFASVEPEDLGEGEWKQDLLSAQGLSDSPAGRGPGGVVAKDGIRRDASLNLVALRSLGGETAEETRTLQRYILGLSIVAFLAPADLYLRQGCLLTASQKMPAEYYAVHRNGSREPVAMSEAECLAYARAAADEFGVGLERVAEFDPAAVKKASEADKKKGKK